MMLYPLLVVIGLAFIPLGFLVPHPGIKMACWACSFASFLLAALAVAGVIH